MTNDKLNEKEDIEAVLQKVEEYVEHIVNIIYEICILYRRNQNEYLTFEKFEQLV